MTLKRLYSRYYCTQDTTHRVYPYDTFDQSTEAPIVGKTGETVLLRTLNSNSDGNSKWGWCWSCKQWVQCQRRTQHQVMSEYFRREGVVIRAKPNELTRKINKGKR